MKICFHLEIDGVWDDKTYARRDVVPVIGMMENKILYANCDKKADKNKEN